MGIAWILFGALIGISAAQRRGFGTASGVIGGILLGPLAVLMYLVSSDRYKCPECAEWVKVAAKICPHCKSRLSDVSKTASETPAVATWIFRLAVLIIIYCVARAFF